MITDADIGLAVPGDAAAIAALSRDSIEVGLPWRWTAARVAGAKHVVLEARRDSPAARAFYREQGYHERFVVPAMYSGVIDGVGLVKRLRGPGPATH